MNAREFKTLHAPVVEAIWLTRHAGRAPNTFLTRVFREFRTLVSDPFALYTDTDPKAARSAAFRVLWSTEKNNSRPKAISFKDPIPHACLIQREYHGPLVTERFQLPDRVIQRVRDKYPTSGPRSLPSIHTLHVEFTSLPKAE